MFVLTREQFCEFEINFGLVRPVFYSFVPAEGEFLVKKFEFGWEFGARLTAKLTSNQTPSQLREWYLKTTICLEA